MAAHRSGRPSTSRGNVMDATAEFSDGDGRIDCDPALEHFGLGEGDRVDVTLRAAL